MLGAPHVPPRRAPDPQPPPSPQLARPPPVDPDAPRRVHVGKLTRNVTDAHVKEIFSTWGEVLSAKVGARHARAPAPRAAPPVPARQARPCSR